MNASETPITILTVCTGNICRSPLAEQMLRLRLSNSVEEFRFTSAGLHAVVGAPMEENAAQQLISYGGDPSTPLGEQLSDEHARNADLILTMTKGQREETLGRHPFSMQRTFTLTEFAALLPLTAPDLDFRSRIREAARMRSQIMLTANDDVPDPINASLEVHAAVAQQIVQLVDHISAELQRD